MRIFGILSKRGSLHKRRSAVGPGLALGRFLASVNGWLGLCFGRLAAYLNRKTCYWNRSAKLVALGLFCLVFGSLCLWLLCKALIF